MEDIDIKPQLMAVESVTPQHYEDYILNSEGEETEATSNYNNSLVAAVTNGEEPSIEQVLNANNDFNCDYPRPAVYINNNDDIECLPGYRFNPTDYELIVHYLWRKVRNQPLPHNKIREVKLYDYNPEDITKTEQGLVEKEWYFFTPRDRKYRNGERPNRAAGNGYWKATGADKKVFYGGVHVGNRKALVFYVGKAPKGDKTNWIMHEFRVEAYKRARTSDDDMKLDDWVLCRIYKKDDKYKKAPRQNHARNSTTEQHSPIEVPSESPNPVNIYRGNQLPLQRMISNGQRMISNGHLQYQNTAHTLNNASFNNSQDAQNNASFNNSQDAHNFNNASSSYSLPLRRIQPQPQPLMNSRYFQQPLRNHQDNFVNYDYDDWINAISENAYLDFSKHQQKFDYPLSFQNDPINSFSDDQLKDIVSPENPQAETLQNVETDQSST